MAAPPSICPTLKWKVRAHTMWIMKPSTNNHPCITIFQSPYFRIQNDYQIQTVVWERWLDCADCRPTCASHHVGFGKRRRVSTYPFTNSSQETYWIYQTHSKKQVVRSGIRTIALTGAPTSAPGRWKVPKWVTVSFEHWTRGLETLVVYIIAVGVVRMNISERASGYFECGPTFMT
jgi:hypothetical protein